MHYTTCIVGGFSIFFHYLKLCYLLWLFQHMFSLVTEEFISSLGGGGGEWEDEHLIVTDPPSNPSSTFRKLDFVDGNPSSSNSVFNGVAYVMICVGWDISNDMTSWYANIIFRRHDIREWLWLSEILTNAVIAAVSAAACFWVMILMNDGCHMFFLVPK